MDSFEHGLPEYASAENIDETTIVVRMIPPSGLLEESSMRIFCDCYGSNASLEEASALVASIAWNQELQGYEPHVLKQQLTRFEWGASGTGLQFLLEVSSNVTAGTILLGLGYVAGRLNRMKPKQPPEPTDIVELETQARVGLTRTFELDPEEADKVILCSSETVADTGHFRYEAPNGIRFDAVVGRLESGHYYVSVTKLPCHN